MNGEKEYFDGIANVFNSEFIKDTSLSAIENTLQVITNEKRSIENVANKKLITLKDKDYLEEKTKTLIEMSLKVLTNLKDDIKIGSSARDYEVFAKLGDTIVNQIRELRELNKMISDMEIFNNEEPEDKAKVNVNIKMTGKEMLELFKKIKEESSMNAVDAEFVIKDDKDDKDE